MPTNPELESKAGAKRKRSAVQKFYAVHTGHKPGIYNTWDECREQIAGCKKAKFKSFPTLTEAEDFLANGYDSKTASTKPYEKYYAVKNGKIPGIYTDWSSAQEQIIKWMKPIYRGFATRAEAQAFLEEGKQVDEKDISLQTTSGTGDGHASTGDLTYKKQRTSGSTDTTPQKLSHVSASETSEDYRPGEYLPPGAEDGFDMNVILKRSTSDVVFKNQIQRNATKLQATNPTSEQMLCIYTDGSSLRNGQKGAFAGVGVYFGPADSRNISEALPGAKQTNQRAELTAIVRALDTAPKNRDVTIVTDSEYSINCATKWYAGWREHNWKTSTGKDVANRDIVESIVSRIEERTTLGSKTVFEWIKGHADQPGNVEADRLAVNGAREAARLPLK